MSCPLAIICVPTSRSSSPSFRPAKRALEIFVTADRVAIKAGDARLRKHAVQQLFQLL